MDYLILFILLAIIAEILGTVGGFGSSLFFVPIASYFLDFHSVLGVTALFHVFSNLTKIYFFRSGFNRKLLFTVGVPSVIFVILGAFISKHIQTFYLEVFLSIFLISISLIFLVFSNIHLKANLFNSILGGSFSGLVAGLIGTGGAIRGLTLSSFNLNKEIFIATSAIIDLGIDSSRTLVYFFNGFIHKDDLYLIPILFVVSIIGTFLGKKILNLMSEKQFKKIVLILILFTGIVSLSKFFV
jgi:uncharacterized membrane protein YfcA